MMLPTRSERIADLQQALERHKALAVLMTAWTKTDELIIEKSVNNLRQTRQAISEVERQQAEVEAALAKLNESDESIFPTEVILDACTECGAHAVNPNTDHCMKCESPQRIGGEPPFVPPVGTDAAPEPPQTNQQ